MTADPREGTVRHPADSSDVTLRRAWASAHLQAARAHGHIPRYGEPDWHKLSPTDPRRWAAVIIAAECWAQDGDDIPARMRRELADQRAADLELYVDDMLRAEDDYARMAAGIRRRANTPTWAELKQRRGEA